MGNLLMILSIYIYNINIELLDSLLYEKVNIVRRQHGKDPLKTLPQLHKVSQHHSKYMAITGHYSHDETVENDSITPIHSHIDRFKKYRDTINGVKIAECIMSDGISKGTRTFMGRTRESGFYDTYNEMTDLIINAWVTSKKGHRYYFLMDTYNPEIRSKKQRITHFSIAAYPTKIKHYKRTGTTSNGLDWVREGIEVDIYFTFNVYFLY